MPVFEVRTPEHTYPNIVERGALARLSNLVPTDAGKLFLVTTEDVWNLHGHAVTRQFPERHLDILYFAGGEQNKRMAAVESLAEQLSLAGADRSSVVIGFGGGIVTDISGFLAAIFMRGLRVVQVPTTLLAQVDAATGGKTGVNLSSGKNLIGCFHQPLAVLIDPDILGTLSAREYRAGLYEVVKCGVIRDPDLFRQFELHMDAILQLDPDRVEQLIAAAVRVKTEVVTADEKEGDLRRILNFGHTVGHAIESETGYTRFLHGEAIGCGMLTATRIAELMNLLGHDEAARVTSVITRMGELPPTKDLDSGRLLAAMGRDKKTLHGTLHFVLPDAIGSTQIVNNVPATTIVQAIRETLQ